MRNSSTQLYIRRTTQSNIFLSFDIKLSLFKPSHFIHFMDSFSPPRGSSWPRMSTNLKIQVLSFIVNTANSFIEIFTMPMRCVLGSPSCHFPFRHKWNWLNLISFFWKISFFATEKEQCNLLTFAIAAYRFMPVVNKVLLSFFNIKKINLLPSLYAQFQMKRKISALHFRVLTVMIVSIIVTVALNRLALKLSSLPADLLRQETYNIFNANWACI